MYYYRIIIRISNYVTFGDWIFLDAYAFQHLLCFFYSWFGQVLKVKVKNKIILTLLGIHGFVMLWTVMYSVVIRTLLL